MARYEVGLQISACVWVDVEADSEEEAEKDARAVYSISEAQWHEVVDVDIKKYTDAEAEPQL